MNESSQHLEDIRVIKKIMEESSRFLSLSGFSGIVAGLFAIGGAVIAKVVISGSEMSGSEFTGSFFSDLEMKRIVLLLFADAAAVLALALSTAVIFSYMKAKKKGYVIWTAVTRRMLLNLFVPLFTGGLFLIFTLGKVPANVTVASMLIFYGLALVNASKFTLGEIYWLGVAEVIIGLICLILPDNALLLWMTGFGFLHILYGLFMELKYR